MLTHQYFPVIRWQRLHKNLMHWWNLMTWSQKALRENTQPVSHYKHLVSLNSNWQLLFNCQRTVRMCHIEILEYSGGKRSTDQIAHCGAVPALHLSSPAFLPVVDTAPHYGCPGWRRFCFESSWGTLEIHGPRTTPKPGSELRHTKHW